MTPDHFSCWLKGFIDLNADLQQPSPEQWKLIVEQFKACFPPPMIVVSGSPCPEEVKRVLREASANRMVVAGRPMIVECVGTQWPTPHPGITSTTPSAGSTNAESS